jgi:hypothetical protein
MAWVALPGGYATASITLRVIGALNVYLYDKTIVIVEKINFRKVNFENER